MSLFNCEINLFLTWSANGDISEVDRPTAFAIIDTKLSLYQQLIMQNY